MNEIIVTTKEPFLIKYRGGKRQVIRGVKGHIVNTHTIKNVLIYEINFPKIGNIFMNRSDFEYVLERNLNIL